MKPSACLRDRSGEGARGPGCGDGGEGVALGNVLSATIRIMCCDEKYLGCILIPLLMKLC